MPFDIAEVLDAVKQLAAEHGWIITALTAIYIACQASAKGGTSAWRGITWLSTPRPAPPLPPDSELCQAILSTLQVDVSQVAWDAKAKQMLVPAGVTFVARRDGSAYHLIEIKPSVGGNVIEELEASEVQKIQMLFRAAIEHVEKREASLRAAQALRRIRAEATLVERA